MAENKELTHAEVWDDSTLLNSWDAALQEYKKYHSIQASGATVGSVPASTKEEGEVKDHTPEPQLMTQSSVEAGHKPPSHPPFPPSILAGGQYSTLHRPPVIHDYIILISLSENEALRNLMISWYFAGYYTGLYEGQQKQ
ncbi:hypothetical protein BGX38DRAFT_1103995 [Terfezia claveryi]|nr:hypothetical protein BGX38DRAFT_1103995 [Terfezia claveryi]